MISPIIDSIIKWANWIIKSANDNEGFIGLILGLPILGGGLVALLRRRTHRRKAVAGKRTAKQIYLEHVIEAHQHLPVAGFETNVRIPIPLEKVYVTLRARMTELERIRGEGDEGFVTHGAPPPDRDVTVQDALKFAVERRYDGVVILGGPGSGKTTLAKYFLLCFATGKAKANLGISQKLLPILLFLRDVDPQSSLVENILSRLEKYELGLDGQFFTSYLRNGEALLLLDGLDEVATEEKRGAVSQWIHDRVHRAFHQCPVIVTSRFSGYRGGAVLPGHYLRLEIQDYRLPQVKQFLENWLTAVETHVNADTRHWRTQAREKAADLYHRVETTKALRDLAVNPLMLQIIALVHRDYILIPGAVEKIVFESTGKPAPDYPLYFAKYPVTNALYRHFIGYLAGKSIDEATTLRRGDFAESSGAVGLGTRPYSTVNSARRSLLRRAEPIAGFVDYLGGDPARWADKLRSSRDDDKRFNGDDQPVVEVSWYAAVAYCHWLTELTIDNRQLTIDNRQSSIFRLPTKAEWEWAASGGRRKYPCGDEEPDDSRANYGQKVGHITPVSAYPAGTTPEGVMDMAGNVWEWMENLYQADKEWRALRGGSWWDKPSALLCAGRLVNLPSFWGSGVGFRVVCRQSGF